MEKTIAELEALVAEAKKSAEDAGGTDENLNQLQKEAEDALVKAQADIDYKKELEALELNKPPQRTEKEKAKFTVDKIYERFPDLKESAPPVGDSELRTELLRNQVEGIIRASSKTEDEVKVKMFHYDHKIVKTGNIHEDADNAIWLANKGRTRNAIAEQQRNPGEPGASAGAGQRTPTDSAPELSTGDVKRLTQLGLKLVSPGHWEGEKVVLKWDKTAKAWNQTFK